MNAKVEEKKWEMQKEKKTIHQRKDMRTTARQINTRYLGKSCRAVDRAGGDGHGSQGGRTRTKHRGWETGREPAGDEVDSAKRVGRSKS